MKSIRNHICIWCIVALSGLSVAANAQEQVDGTVEFDSMIHNFGDVMLSDGPLSCTFTMKNISGKPVVIYSVITSCGCTDVQWSKEPVLPGKTARISAKYTNDEGPYPFEKTLTVNVSGISKPILLRLRGSAHEKKMSMEEMFSIRMGKLGFKDTELKCGNLEAGGRKSDGTEVANLSSKPVKVSFTDVSEGLSLTVTPNPVPAGKTAKVTFTVTAVDGIWGKNWYYATPVADGVSTGRQLKIFAFTKENFSNWTKEQKDNASRPMFSASTYSFGKIKEGEKLTAKWDFSNVGKGTFKAYKVDVDAGKWSASPVPEIKGGGKGSFSVELDTAGMPKGETLVIVTLTTNSPARPIINLFITGWIE
ncbi:MAG: DUF1573 domain-containing protein [Clostridium sp.]|nr:DUF1573 domain-containing protein [Bacteroides sp.]MCM1198867.1 DUF1573 domain-containing protein [Clostridium sp.]